MKKLYIILCVLLISSSYIYAFNWDSCITKYQKAKQFSENTRLLYIYLKSTKTCLIKFKNFLVENPDPEFTLKAMNNNILMIENNIKKLLPKYEFPENSLEQIPKYINTKNKSLTYNTEYNYFKKFNNCNGIHAQNKIYTAKHCNISNSKNLQYDLNAIQTVKTSIIQISKIDLNKKGTFKYYSMSKEGMFFNVLLKENNCKFYKAKNIPTGLNKTLDITDLTKNTEIRSTCLAIPSNSGGGVFQDGKLVAIISKTVFNNDKFMYSIVEPIIPINEIKIASMN